MKLIRILTILIILSGCSSKKENPCIDRDISESLTLLQNQVVCFQTVDSYDLDYTNKESLTVFGKLSVPNIKKSSYPAVVLSHGSGGIRRYHEKYVNLLTENGYVVFQIDHYSNRNIRYDKTFSKVSGITFMNDSYKALQLIKSHPNINKVGYIGWSQGGVGPILSHFKHVTDFIESGKFNFDASIAIYPYCGFTFPGNSKTMTPLLMLTGNDDDLTPAKTCLNLYTKFFKNDGKIRYISFENARHGYDNPFLYFGMTFDNLPSLNINNDSCTLTISKKGQIKTLSNKIINGPKESEKLLNACSTKGVTVKYDSIATEKTQEIVINYFSEYLN